MTSFAVQLAVSSVYYLPLYYYIATSSTSTLIINYSVASMSPSRLIPTILPTCISLLHQRVYYRVFSHHHEKTSLLVYMYISRRSRAIDKKRPSSLFPEPHVLYFCLMFPMFIRILSWQLT